MLPMEISNLDETTEAASFLCVSVVGLEKDDAVWWRLLSLLS